MYYTYTDSEPNITFKIFNNYHCIKCLESKKVMIKIGAFILCSKCKKEEFGDVNEISPYSTQYLKWLSVYKEM